MNQKRHKGHSECLLQVMNPAIVTGVAIVRKQPTPRRCPVSKYVAFRVDDEVGGIADKLRKTHDAFGGIDLSTVCFLRVENDRSKATFRIIPNEFPYTLNSPCTHFIQIFNGKWNELGERRMVNCVKRILAQLPEHPQVK